MSISSETLKVGDLAPDFSLAAVNVPGRFRLSELLAKGTTVVEFLRGTW